MKIPFQYDYQTFNDLEIEKERDERSVFSIFNETYTAGGRSYLRELIKTPITDIEELEKRTNLLKYFIKKPLNLEVSKRHLNYIEKYFNLSVSVLKSNFIDSNYLKFTEWIRPTNDYYLIKAGCENLVYVLSQFESITSSSGVPKELAENTAHIKELISLLKKEGFSSTKFRWNQIIKLDQLFRKQFQEKCSLLLQEIYLLDAYGSVAKSAVKNDFTLPEYDLSSKITFEAKELKHPLLADAIPNDIDFGLHQNMCFLTGPNMAGKSTFLKSIGIAVYLAHLGFPVPAKKLRTSIFSGIITTINLSDNLSFGYSHFYSEVNRVKEAALAIAEGRQMFVIFDELFRGTNVKDAFEASTEIIKGFAQVENCIFIMSTHIVEIAEEIKASHNISFKYFSSELSGDTLNYSYTLKSGISDERLGMHIIKKEGIFDLLQNIKK